MSSSEASGEASFNMEDLGDPLNLYSYTPLDPNASSFRLVRLLPSSDSQPIKCTLSEYPLDDAPPYTALSYTWSPEGGSGYIECDGRLVQGTNNLRHFLRQFGRSPENYETLLWVDAICINQQDIGERSRQVALMANIYSNASLVYVWLGLEDQDTKAAFDIFAVTKGLGHRRRSRADPLAIAALEEVPASQWTILGKLLWKPYWRRVWIVQEFLLAKNIIFYCGPYSSTIDNLLHLRELRKYGWDLPLARKTLNWHPAWSLIALRDCSCHKKWDRRSFAFASVLRVTADKLCADPRDRIYGVLGITTDAHKIIAPDYTKSIPEILVDIIRKLCHWKNRKGRTASINLIESLRKSLDVSAEELREHIISSAPELVQHMYAFLGSRNHFFTVTERIGTIVSVASYVPGDEQALLKIIKRWKCTFPEKFVSEESLWPLEKLLEQVRSLDVRAVANLYNSGFYGFAKGVGSLNRTRLQWVETFFRDLVRKNSLSHMGTPHITNGMNSGNPDCQLNLFLDHRGHIGISTEDIGRGDFICKCLESGSPQSAMILRQPDKHEVLNFGIEAVASAVFTSAISMLRADPETDPSSPTGCEIPPIGKEIQGDSSRFYLVEFGPEWLPDLLSYKLLSPVPGLRDAEYFKYLNLLDAGP